MKRHYHDKCFTDVTTGQTITWLTVLFEPDVDVSWKEFSDTIKLEFPGKECRLVRVGELDGLELQVEYDAPKTAKNKSRKAA